jgi:hypothetical protein
MRRIAGSLACGIWFFLVSQFEWLIRSSLALLDEPKSSGSLRKFTAWLAMFSSGLLLVNNANFTYG